jgi:predicted ATPase/DNA-binding XRE family transcriptional regulator
MDEHELSTFGTVLRTLRVSAGLSQERLSERAGVSTRGLSDLERGARRLPRLETVRMLADALELCPEDRARLFQAARPEGQDAATASSAGMPRAIPLPPTPLIGRDALLASIVALLGQPMPRLVTLTGPGGVGKTRLAEATATAVSFRDGARFVALAPVSSPALVMPKVAETLGVAEAPGIEVETAVAHSMLGKQVLLVLDNFEHVILAAPLVADLLASCPELKILVTSRKPLGVRGEQRWPVPPLDLPADTPHVTHVEAIEAAAVQLFANRATAVSPGFAITNSNAGDVVAICRRLDGLPLAIELAAAWTGMLSPADMLARLDRRLPLLTEAAPDMPRRHQTMRATIAWSHDLLRPAEAAVFRRLAVFTGGFTLDAARAVATPEGADDILDELIALVNISLVSTVDGREGGMRFHMLETVREFALDQLADSGERHTMERRHATHFLDLAIAASDNLADATGHAWLSRLIADQANLRAALSWLRDHGQAVDGLRLATAMGGFWRLRNTAGEGHLWLETFLAAAAGRETAPELRVAALHWAGELAGLEGDFASADRHLEEGLALARQTGDKPGATAILTATASILAQTGEVARSIPLFEEAASYARDLGARRQAAFLTAYLAIAVGHQGDQDRARLLMLECESHLRALGDVRSFETGFAMMVSGFLELFDDDADRAVDRFAAAVEMAREIDAGGIVATSLAGLGETGLRVGRPDLAASRYREGLDLAQQIAFPPAIAYNLQGLVRLAARQGDWPRAARLVGALERVVGAIRAMPPATVADYAAAERAVSRSLPAHEHAAQLAIGRELSMAAVLDEAHALADAAAQQPE